MCSRMYSAVLVQALGVELEDDVLEDVLGAVGVIALVARGAEVGDDVLGPEGVLVDVGDVGLDVLWGD